jgi:hypothetical protein
MADYSHLVVLLFIFTLPVSCPLQEGRTLPGLTDLKVPLGKLQTVGSLIVYNMDALTDLKGLEALRSVNRCTFLSPDE